MLRQRGYPGSAVQVRRLVRRLRPEALSRVYRRVVTLAGEQAQVDWGTFGKVRIGRGVRAVSGFVMVLGYSRALYALVTLDQTLESFLRGHVKAFQAIGGVARTLVYDNLRSAVLDRRGTAIQFHPRLLDLAGHYHFAPRPCTPARGNEKGKVERQIQYLRHACFAARPFRDLDDLNAQFRRWRDDVAHQRRHPDLRDRTVAEVLAEEQPRLLSLPAHPFETDLVRAVRSGKTPYIRFDRNSYSIPHTHVRRPLTLVASATLVGRPRRRCRGGWWRFRSRSRRRWSWIMRSDEIRSVGSVALPGRSHQTGAEPSARLGSVLSITQSTSPPSLRNFCGCRRLGLGSPPWPSVRYPTSTSLVSASSSACTTPGRSITASRQSCGAESPTPAHIAPLWSILGKTPLTKAHRTLCHEVCEALAAARWRSWFDDRETERELWSAILAHHGSLRVDPPPVDPHLWCRRVGYDPLGAMKALAEAISAMFPNAFAHEHRAQLPDSSRFQHAFAGLVTLADWIGSDETVLPVSE